MTTYKYLRSQRKSFLLKDFKSRQGNIVSVTSNFIQLLKAFLGQSQPRPRSLIFCPIKVLRKFPGSSIVAKKSILFQEKFGEHLLQSRNCFREHRAQLSKSNFIQHGSKILFNIDGKDPMACLQIKLQLKGETNANKSPHDSWKLREERILCLPKCEQENAEFYASCCCQIDKPNDRISDSHPHLQGCKVDIFFITSKSKRNSSDSFDKTWESIIHCLWSRQ